MDFSSGSEPVKEEWIVQQGVGDVNNDNQKWQFVGQVKPKHGIAAPLAVSSEDIKHENFKGQVFCFLPLPISSRLPVHINGNFILNSTRLNLWIQSDRDDKTRWNENLIRAIGSSYQKFLSNIKQYFFIKEVWSSRGPLLHAVYSYYNIFPGMNSDSLDQQWHNLMKDVYTKLVASDDAYVMAVVESKMTRVGSPSLEDRRPESFSLHWHTCTDHSSSQVYFWKSRSEYWEYDTKTIRPILECIGMKITSAPLQLMSCFNRALKESEDEEMVPITPDAVYLYYKKYHTQCSLSGFPCPIANTSFSSITKFKSFISYLLCNYNAFSGEYSFSAPPFKIALLLTEDGYLRCFDENVMTIRSKFSSIFPRCHDRFLHSNLLDICYSSSYFACSSDQTSCEKLVLKILSKSLPFVLFSNGKIDNAGGKKVSTDMLKDLWTCFDKDPMFQEALSHIVESCAIIPSTSGFLYSTSNPLLPIVINPETSKDEVVIIEVLTSIGMPFVDTKIVFTKIDCPTLADHDKVLVSIYNLFKEDDFTALMNDTRVSAIIQYLMYVNFRYSVQYCTYVMSLPLYKTVDGKFVSIYQKDVYIWPGANMCDIAYGKWIAHTNATFLKPGDAWTSLATPDQLSLNKITCEDVYIKYIFLNFRHLNDDERYAHLKYIRDVLFYENKLRQKTRFAFSQRSATAKNFIDGLCDLKCLRDEQNVLRKVSEFCDHNEVIFKTFSKQFRFLPDQFRDSNDEWMSFFKELGLRTTVTKSEFQKFCTEVSTGNHSHLTNASTILVKHLFSNATEKEEWYLDNVFLAKISSIPFVVTERTESLNWIINQAKAEVTITQRNIPVNLASPGQAALDECRHLLWTVKPMVNLYLPDFLSKESKTILDGIKVTKNETASSTDVITNISNICKSNFANFSLFDTYPDTLKPPEGGLDLMEVMSRSFHHLTDKVSESELITLSSLPCVPVYSISQTFIKWQLVLLKPCYVVNNEVEGFHPYLHHLPDDLMPVLPLMMKIGVKNSIDLSHIQVVLEKAYEMSQNEKLDVNTQKCVVKILKKLKSLLSEKEKQYSDAEKVLSPLYLPRADGRLNPSTSLIYGDTKLYRGQLRLNLEGTAYAQLNIRKREYDFYDSEFCDILPVGIKPKKMSELCEPHMISQCTEVPHSAISLQIKSTLQLNLMSRAILNVIVHHMKDRDSASHRIKAFIDVFLSNIEIITVRNLQVVIKLREAGKEIGKVTTDYFLQHEGVKSILYLDDKIDIPFDDHALSQLSEHIMSHVLKENPEITTEVSKQIERKLKFLLKVQNTSQIDKFLQKEGISMQSNGNMEFPSPELGEEIPVSWHHRLDQDIDNIFYPNEWVGYEDHENHIVFAQIGYPVLPDDLTDLESIPRVKMIYKIFLRSDDLEGVEVSGLELFKFIKGRVKVTVAQDQLSDDQAGVMVLHEGNADEIENKPKNNINFEDIKSIKEKICKELMEIWKLPEDLKKKAIKRLYLKWHPDKNPDNLELAEEIFKFLMKQIERLEKGKPLSSDEDDTCSYGTSTNSSHWSSSWFDFSYWDSTAKEHGYWHRREQKHHSSGFGKSHGHRDRFGAESFFHENTSNDKENDDEGWRWVNQAEVDFNMLKVTNSCAQSEPALRGYGLVCFLAHQVAEKALQGGVFALCGKDKRNVFDHSLIHRAYMLQARRLGQTFGLMVHIAPLEKYYLTTRYPNQWKGEKDIPADHFTSSDAECAVKNAAFVLEMVKGLMPN